MGPDRVAGGERGRVRGLPLVLVSLLVVGVAAAGVAIDRDGGGPKAGPGDAFYTLPKHLPVAEAGTIIRSAEVPAPAGAVGTKVLYHSRALDGRDIAVSGVIYTPTGAAPAGGRDVVSYAHGTTGVADICAPSRAADPATALPGLGPLLRAGYVVAATDYEGLGTPGIHPYLVGGSEARSVLDIARAAQRLPGAHAGRRVVVDGHSQGGHAALFAGQIAPQYAPDLDVLGVSAGAPVTDVAAFLWSSRTIDGFHGFPVLAAAGYHAVYPTAALSVVFSPQAIDAVALAEKQCDVEKPFISGRTPVLVADPSTTAPWDDLFRRNSPGYVTSKIPVLVWQGGKDPLVPETKTAEYVQRVCAQGETVTEKVYPGANHASVLTAARPDVDRWIAARFAGTPVSGCSASQPSVRS